MYWVIQYFSNSLDNYISCFLKCFKPYHMQEKILYLNYLCIWQKKKKCSILEKHNHLWLWFVTRFTTSWTPYRKVEKKPESFSNKCIGRKNNLELLKVKPIHSNRKTARNVPINNFFFWILTNWPVQ